MTTPKSRGTEDDDVILFMDELTTTGSTTAVDGASSGRISPSIVSESLAPTTLEKGRPSLRLLDTDHVNNYDGRDTEIDEFEPEDHHRGNHHRTPYPGIDDGLLTDSEDEKNTTTIPASPRPRPSETPAFPAFGDPTIITQTIPDLNVYQQKKTIAQGMMDLALISANANQFRYVLQSSGNHPYFYPSLAMIGLSLFLQVIVGIGLIWNSRYNVKDDDQMCKANRANNWTVICIFLVTILNVFISSFGVVESTQIIFTPSSGT